MGEGVQDGSRLVTLGRITGLYGVTGWVRVFSFTEPREAILGYSPWHLERRGRREVLEVEDARRHGKGLVAKLAGCDDRDAARGWLGADVAVRRDQLPPAQPGEHYWVDLVGLEVVTAQGRSLGRVTGLMPTGANDVLVVEGERERLVPFIQPDVVYEVDPRHGVVRVDWDPDF